jgi:regulator of protease activity HflC (stomatin/prohibitin superfamily)
MESALGWIGQIFEWLGKFIPRWEIVPTTMGAIKYKQGKNPVYCGPGIHWYWPAVTKWDPYPMVRQSLDLRTQTVMTMDDRIVAVGGLVVYEVSDLLKLMPTTFQPDSAISEIVLTAFHDVCCNLTWAELKTEQQKGTLDTKLRRAAQRELADYGVRVIKAQLTDLAPTKVYKIIQSTSMDA